MAGVEDKSFNEVDVGIKRAYRKRGDSKKPSQGSGMVSVRVQLNKLSDKDIADAKMASVFGDSNTAATTTTKTPMRVNPLYEKNGTMEVPASELRRKRPGSDAGSIASSTRTSGHQGGTNNLNRVNGSVNTVSQNVPMDVGNTRNGQPVAYAGNFELRRGGPKDRQLSSQTSPRRNGSVSEDRKTDDLGRVLPARVQKNTMPRSYLPPTIPSRSPFMTPRQSIVNGGDVDITIANHAPPKTTLTKEEAEQIIRRARIRRRWRCVLFVILASLVFALILIILLVFTTR